MNQDVSLLGYQIKNIELKQVVAEIISKVNEPHLYRVLTLNSEMIGLSYNNKQLKSWLQTSHLVVADGQGLGWAGKVLKNFNIKVVTGISIVMKLIENQNRSIYFIGGTQVVIDKLINNIGKNPKCCEIAGYRNGYFLDQETQSVIDDIVTAQPDIILVGLGFPKQEQFIEALSKKYNKGVAIGVGGSFDVIAEFKKHAPKWVRRLKCEWLFRGLQEPSRIVRWKYLLKFMLLVFKKRRNKQVT
tara:strand:+ start:2432 stop:3163 length:732 start_codon:yes stop_codon:yes gene_type:complete